MFEFSARAPGPPDGLFLERLEAFMEKCLADIKAFSEREYRPFEETRQYVAEWHSKYLFDPPLAVGTTMKHENASKVRSVLCNASRILESLCEVSGVHSFVLAVDPNNPSDGGFLGGSIVGREFWRGLRGGGDAGAKSFKAYCLRDIESQTTPSFYREEGPSNRVSSASAKSAPAKSLKNDLYESVRKALRTTSGIRNAEMKWTNPERLDVYGVRLVGWPASVPAQNPSSLKVNQNKCLLECLENGTMRFEKLYPPSSTIDHAENYNIDEGNGADELDKAEDFSWAYDADGGNPSLDDSQYPISQSSTDTTQICTLVPNIGSTEIIIGNIESNNFPDCRTNLSSAEPSSRKRPRNSSDV